MSTLAKAAFEIARFTDIQFAEITEESITTGSGEDKTAKNPAKIISIFVGADCAIVTVDRNDFNVAELIGCGSDAKVYPPIVSMERIISKNIDPPVSVEMFESLRVLGYQVVVRNQKIV